MKTTHRQFQSSYKIIFLIISGVIGLQIGIELEFLDSPHFVGLLIVTFPLAVSISSFVVARIYRGSKVFGRSYFALGLGYFAIFVAELHYVYYLDISNQPVPAIADYLIIAFYPLALVHLIINIRYFSERLQNSQKISLVLIPSIIILVYSLLVAANQIDDISYFFYTLIFVALTSITLGFAVVGISLFRQTAMFNAWLLLLVGILLGTIGDVIYYYGDIVGLNWVENNATLWIASNAIMIYALYRHQKSI